MGKILKKIVHNIRTEIEGCSRGEVTRARILAAARNVFARQSFHAASIRMIAREGDFAHGIIRYHFPSKAALFKEIVKETCEDFYSQNSQWLKEVSTMPLQESFSVYMDRLLAYNRNNPQALRMLSQNLGQGDKPENTPGYEYIIGLINRTTEEFIQAFATEETRDLVRRFSYAFYGMAFYFLGASSCQSRVLKTDPASHEYSAWVKKTMQTVFYPLLEKIFSSRQLQQD